MLKYNRSSTIFHSSLSPGVLLGAYDRYNLLRFGVGVSSYFPVSSGKMSPPSYVESFGLAEFFDTMQEVRVNLSCDDEVLKVCTRSTLQARTSLGVQPVCRMRRNGASDWP